MAIEDWDLQLGNRILSKIKNNGFLSCITKAERGYGKSMYNLKVMAYVFFHLLDITENQAWKMALDNFIFTPSHLIERIEYNIEHDVIDPVWCIDDATVHFSSYLFFINVYQTALVNAAFDTIRTVVHGMLINCPQKKRLLRALQNYDDYEVTLYIDRGYERKAVCIKYFSLPDGKQKFRKEFEDHFSCYVPKWIYDLYMEKRKMYLKEINEELKVLRSKLEQRKTKNDSVIEIPV